MAFIRILPAFIPFKDQSINVFVIEMEWDV